MFARYFTTTRNDAAESRVRPRKKNGFGPLRAGGDMLLKTTFGLALTLRNAEEIQLNPSTIRGVLKIGLHSSDLASHFQLNKLIIVRDNIA